MSQQIRLIALQTYDLFTQQEWTLYQKIIQDISALERLKSDTQKNPAAVSDMIALKKADQDALTQCILAHDSPRELYLPSVINRAVCERQGDSVIYPPGITWQNLKNSKKIAEFVSEESRALGLQDKDITFDKIILSWKNLDILRQIVLYGFTVPILYPDGTVEHRKYRFMTASAGQLRTDKIQCISEAAWTRIHLRLMGGLTFEDINSHGGINVNKLLAYIALGTSATDEWDMSIDRCICIEDFEAPVTGLVDFVYNDYSIERKEATTVINHTDGCGMMLPSVSRYNFMVRAPWIKGLLVSFDYIALCKEHDCPAVIKDVYGQEHDLIQEDIQIIFTKSQFKLWKYYSSWQEYKDKFKQNGCRLNRTNFEEPYIADTEINYQMLQTLQDFTDDEITQFTQRTHDRIVRLCTSSQAMLEALRADLNEADPYKRSLSLYPELLRDGYTKESIKAIKLRWTLDAKSGRIRCSNKRLFAIPDLYAACEHWFLGIKEPKGLLENGCVWARLFANKQKIGVLRSPHLYKEWTIRRITNDPKITKWFYTNGIYTSCHDLISKVLQFDVDGDQLNCIGDDLLISVAERDIKKYDIVPLLYELGKASASQITQEEMYKGLKRAHDYSGIGQVSNSLTKLWNRPDPDRESAARLCFYNNLVIDAAKTGFINGFENYPDVQKQINKATGGKNSRMPFFFQFSKNGRKESYKRTKHRFVKMNQSTMNRICAKFSDIKNINFVTAGVAPFNWQMLLFSDSDPYLRDAVDLYCEIDTANEANLIEARANMDYAEANSSLKYEFVREEIEEQLVSRFGSLEAVYPSIVKYLFAGDNAQKSVHKQMFWRVFGNIACAALEHNMLNHTVCPKCGMKIPLWATLHNCPKNTQGFLQCVDCGKICIRASSKQCRCEECQTEHRRILRNAYYKAIYAKKKKAG